MLHRRERAASVDVVEYGVTMREGAALGVLPGDPDRDAVDEERPKGERLGLAPVDPTLLDGLAPALELLHQLRVRREPVGGPKQLLVQLAQLLGRDCRVHGLRSSGGDATVRRR